MAARQSDNKDEYKMYDMKLLTIRFLLALLVVCGASFRAAGNQRFVGASGFSLLYCRI